MIELMLKIHNEIKLVGLACDLCPWHWHATSTCGTGMPYGLPFETWLFHFHSSLWLLACKGSRRWLLHARWGHRGSFWLPASGLAQLLLLQTVEECGSRQKICLVFSL